MTRFGALDDDALAELRQRHERGEFPGLSLQNMLEFLLSDGIMPETGLPVASFLALEDWARQRSNARSTGDPTAT